MSKYRYVKYTDDEDPVAVLENAIRKHGREEAFMVIPERLYKRWKLSGRHDQLPLKSVGGND